MKSKQWMERHLSDPYVKQANKAGYPSRAAYKLLEIQKRDKILSPGMVVLDIGAAPGGWSMVARELVGKKGRVIALDLLPMKSIAGVEFIQGDFNDEQILAQLLQTINNQLIDIILCDIAPNLAGHKSIDQPRSMQLVESVWELTKQVLKPGGTFLTKVFQGEGLEPLVKDLKQYFKQVKYRKPSASRSESREIYVLAQNFTI